MTADDDAVRRDVDTKLEQFLHERLGVAARAGTTSIDARALAPLHAAASLATRGGKRQRAVLLAAAYEACGGRGGALQVSWAGVALEMLQAYLLIHDDWIDGDETRRGGPSVHAHLEETLGDRRLAGAGAVLAGDHFSALALGALLRVEVEASQLLGATRAFAELQDQVVRGQLVDVLSPTVGAEGGVEIDDVAIEEGYDLKTGSYTVRGPCSIGGALAGARSEQMKSLHAFARPLGIAFQLRDDLLGTFGNPSTTGKPSGNDLRRGNRTTLANHPRIRRHPLFPRVFGNEGAAEEEVEALVHELRASGAEAGVEERIALLTAESLAALDGGDFTDNGKEQLAVMARAMTARSH